MIRQYLLLISLSVAFTHVFAQKLRVEPIIDLSCTAVKSQDKTGTCWSFSTVSFLESEMKRMGFNEMDLSEMYFVRFIYFDKAQNYVLRQGKANFSQGSLSHDVINVVKKHGIMTEEYYPGRVNNDPYNHDQLEEELKTYLDQVIANKERGPYWMTNVNKILDKHLGALPRGIIGKNLSQANGLIPRDYISFTSFKHHPYHSKFILEIPDNYSNGSYFNVPLADLRKIVDHALESGYTVAWDGDVSEKGFKAKEGYALLAPESSDGMWTMDFVESRVSHAVRQSEFFTYKTTDDHLMHIVGKVKGNDGTNYYKVKNSWGSIGPFDGFLYMSEAYFDMKTVGILVHKSAVPEDVKASFE